MSGSLLVEPVVLSADFHIAWTDGDREVVAVVKAGRYTHGELVNVIEEQFSK